MPSKVIPTKNNLINAKRSYSLAEMGHDLMERKRNILLREMSDHATRARELRSEIDAVYAKAYLALQKANIKLGIVSEEAQSIPEDNGLSLDLRSVMGVELPTVKLDSRPLAFYYGLESTDSNLDESYALFEEVKRLTARLSEVENCVLRLGEAVKKTQKRTNALSNVLIPGLKETISYISGALEEKEREEFSRLKAIKNRGERE